MPLGQDIMDIFEAIPRRIEMSGRAPTWRITGASFDDVLRFARESLPADAVVVAREDRSRWWPRVTLTLSVDSHLIAAAPSPVSLRDPPPGPVPEQRARTPVPLWNDEEYAESLTPVQDLFASQEEVRAARRQVPQQRAGTPPRDGD